MHEHFGLGKRQLWELAKGVVDATFAEKEEKERLKGVMDKFGAAEGLWQIDM